MAAAGASEDFTNTGRVTAYLVDTVETIPGHGICTPLCGRHESGGVGAMTAMKPSGVARSAKPRFRRAGTAGLRILGSICCTLAFLLASSGARAASITQVDPFTIAGVPGVALLGFAEFNTPGHTLDRVTVKIAGTLVVPVLLAPGQSATPIVGFDAFGAGGQGFGFAGAGARFVLPTAVNPTLSPLVVTLATGFKLDFKLTELTDLTGVVVPTTSATAASLVPPTTVEGRRSDFAVGVVPIGILETFVFTPLNFAPGGAFSGGGTMTLGFTVWPPLAEPETLATLALGLLALCVLRRRAAGTRPAGCRARILA